VACLEIPFLEDLEETLEGLVGNLEDQVASSFLVGLVEAENPCLGDQGEEEDPSLEVLVEVASPCLGDPEEEEVPFLVALVEEEANPYPEVPVVVASPCLEDREVEEVNPSLEDLAEAVVPFQEDQEAEVVIPSQEDLAEEVVPSLEDQEVEEVIPFPGVLVEAEVLSLEDLVVEEVIPFLEDQVEVASPFLADQAAVPCLPVAQEVSVEEAAQRRRLGALEEGVNSEVQEVPAEEADFNSSLVAEEGVGDLLKDWVMVATRLPLGPVALVGVEDRIQEGLVA